MKNLVWTKGTSGLDGEFQSTSELDFYINRVWQNFKYSLFSVVFQADGNVFVGAISHLVDSK